MAIFLIENPRCVFIHIPKTGGKSMRRVVTKGDRSESMFYQLPQEWRDAFSFAFVRNPFDRMVSAYYWHKKYKHKFGEAARISFGRFVDVALDWSIGFQVRTTWQQYVRHHTIPQTHPYHGLQYAKFIGRFEAIQDDFKVVANRLGVDANELPHVNKSNKPKGYRQFFDKQLRARVERFYRQDLDQLGYNF